MTKRKQRKKPRRIGAPDDRSLSERRDDRRQRPRQGRREEDAPESITADIEEQLRRQRLKRQQQQQKQDQKEEKAENQNGTPSNLRTQKRRLGTYIYDSDREAYFPASSMKRERKRSAKSLEEAADAPPSLTFPARHRVFPHSLLNCDLTATPSPLKSVVALSHAANVCASMEQRHRILCRFRGRALLEGMSVTSFPHRGSRRLNADETPPQSSLAPWSRTLDVGWSRDTMEYPAFLTLDNNRMMLLEWNRPPVPILGHQPRIIFLSGKSVMCIGSLCAAGWISNRTAFCWHYSRDWGGSTAYSFVAGEANDFAALPADDSIVVGTSCPYRGRVGVGVPWRIVRGSHAVKMPIHGYPRSDTLIVETDTTGTIPTLPHSVFFGHRNGQVTVHDIRTQECQSTLPSTAMDHAENFAALGNICSIQLLCDERPHQFLCRGSNGLCRLFDLRRMGKTHAGTSCGSNKDSSVVHDLTISEKIWDLSETRWCRGMATDPSRTCALVPFAAKDGEHHLGMWSLHTGQYLGSKNLSRSVHVRLADMATLMSLHGSRQVTTNAGTTDGDVLELSKTITPAWTCRGMQRQHGDNDFVLEPGSFGLWFRWGNRGIHHCVLNGRFPD